MGQTNLDCLQPCVLRFRIRLMGFDYSISHVPGKSLHTADALSCTPVSGRSDLHIRQTARWRVCHQHCLLSRLLCKHCSRGRRQERKDQRPSPNPGPTLFRGASATRAIGPSRKSFFPHRLMYRSLVLFLLSPSS